MSVEHRVAYQNNGMARVAVDAVLPSRRRSRAWTSVPTCTRSLKMGRSMTIGMLAQDIESPFFTPSASSAASRTGSRAAATRRSSSAHGNQSEELERVGLAAGAAHRRPVILNRLGCPSSRPRHLGATARSRPGAASKGVRSNLKTLRLDNEQAATWPPATCSARAPGASRTSRVLRSTRTRSTATLVSCAH